MKQRLANTLIAFEIKKDYVNHVLKQKIWNSIFALNESIRMAIILL